MDKLKMAHDWAMKSFLTDGFKDEAERAVHAWKYADAMQAEADKREDTSRPDVLNMADSPQLEWQPDWSQAPDTANYWAMDGCGQCNWYAIEPEVCGNQWDFGRVIEQAHTGYGYQGNWQDSLRERPHGF